MNAVPTPDPLMHPTANFLVKSAKTENQAVNMLETMWRYRWAVILPAIIGSVIGLLLYFQLPATYRSTARLMIEASQPGASDVMTGEVRRAVPTVEIVQSQLFSDWVLNNAYEQAKVRPYHERYAEDGQDGFRTFVTEAGENMELEPEVTDIRNAQSVVALLHFESEEQELTKPVVEAFSEALQTYYNRNYASKRGQLLTYIQNAVERLNPQLIDLQRRFSEFRETAPLAWNPDGTAINPYREEQLRLVQDRSVVNELLRSKTVEVDTVKALIERKLDDPILGLNIVGQLLNRDFKTDSTGASLSALREGDFTLAETNLQKDLVPLLIERERMAAELGQNHPSVRSMDVRYERTKEEFTQLLKDQTDRFLELVDTTLMDPKKRATEATEALLLAKQAELGMLKEQLNELDSQITVTRNRAAEITRFEQQNLNFLNEIERTQELENQLRETMTRVSLSEEEQGVKVIELTAARVGRKVGPRLLLTVGFGGLLGLALGGGLALLMEKNANTFRDPEQIAETLQVPILTHIPFFKSRRKRLTKGEVDPLHQLDPSMVVAHSPTSVLAESIRACRTTLFFELPARQGGRLIQLSSPLPGDGKSTVAGNLAISMAQSNKRVCIIDCDLRRPQTTDNFSAGEKLGLTNYLNGECELDDVCHGTPIDNLHVIPSGPVPANPSEALTLREMNIALDELRKKYDYVILDSPPLLVVSDPSILASMVDGVLLVMRVRRKSRQNAREAIATLKSVGANILGLAINSSDETGASDGYRGYGYYRYGRYTSRYRNRSGGAQDNKPVVGSRPAAPEGRIEKPV